MPDELDDPDEGEPPMERRLIQVENLSDQAAIAAALRRAFTAQPIPAGRNNDQYFDALLNRIH